MGRHRLSCLVVFVAATIVLSCCGGPSGPRANNAIAALSGGRWSRALAPPSGSETAWDLSAWTGKYVVAWGSAERCCDPAASVSSQHGAVFDPVLGRWRRLPPAPVAFTAESTSWTGREVLVWGSASAPSGGGGSAPAAASTGATVARNVLFGFNLRSWRWKSLASPNIASRSGAAVTWTGTGLIVFGDQGAYGNALLDGASYDPATDHWSALPPIPSFAVPGWRVGKPAGTTAVWAGNALFVWITWETGRTTSDGGVSSGAVQALRWRPGTATWQRAPGPPDRVSPFEATVVSMGTDIALLDGSGCLPNMSCANVATGRSALLNLSTDRWSYIPANRVLGHSTSFVWTGRALVAVLPDLTEDYHAVGGHSAAFDPSSRLWSDLPQLPFAKAPVSGPAVTGTVWTGSVLLDAGLVLQPRAA